MVLLMFIRVLWNGWRNLRMGAKLVLSNWPRNGYLNSSGNCWPTNWSGIPFQPICGRWDPFIIKRLNEGLPLIYPVFSVGYTPGLIVRWKGLFPRRWSVGWWQIRSLCLNGFLLLGICLSCCFCCGECPLSIWHSCVNVICRETWLFIIGTRQDENWPLWFVPRRWLLSRNIRICTLILPICFLLFRTPSRMNTGSIPRCYACITTGYDKSGISWKSGSS